MIKSVLPLSLLLLISCYPKIQVEGFDNELWVLRKSDCATGILQANILYNQEQALLSNGEAQIKVLLGEPDEHELYTRNQKFFYYDLNSDSCQIIKRLSIRFDAIDRAKEVAIILK